MTIRFGILTLSDRSAQGQREDASGPALADLIHAQNWSVADQAILPDDESAIRKTLVDAGWIAADLISSSLPAVQALLRVMLPLKPLVQLSSAKRRALPRRCARTV